MHAFRRPKHTRHVEWKQTQDIVPAELLLCHCRSLLFRGRLFRSGSCCLDRLGFLGRSGFLGGSLFLGRRLLDSGSSTGSGLFLGSCRLFHGGCFLGGRLFFGGGGLSIVTSNGNTG